MNQEAIEKFKEIRNLFKRLSDEMCLIVESYYIWRALTFAVSIPEMGKEKAEKNASIISRYADFFTATKYSHFQTFILGINKFFDDTRGTLSLGRLITTITDYQYAFKPEVVRAALPELSQRGLIPENYKPIDDVVVEVVTRLKDRHKEVLATLEVVRDQQIAHTAMEATRQNIIPVEVEEFISTIQEMFNLLSGKFDLSFTHWGHLQAAATDTTNYLLKDLELGEQKRMEEWGMNSGGVSRP